jgi:hypothetical protein
MTRSSKKIKGGLFDSNISLPSKTKKKRSITSEEGLENPSKKRKIEDTEEVSNLEKNKKDESTVKKPPLLKKKKKPVPIDMNAVASASKITQLPKDRTNSPNMRVKTESLADKEAKKSLILNPNKGVQTEVKTIEKPGLILFPDQEVKTEVKQKQKRVRRTNNKSSSSKGLAHKKLTSKNNRKSAMKKNDAFHITLPIKSLVKLMNNEQKKRFYRELKYDLGDSVTLHGNDKFKKYKAIAAQAGFKKEDLKYARKNMTKTTMVKGVIAKLFGCLDYGEKNKENSISELWKEVTGSSKSSLSNVKFMMMLASMSIVEFLKIMQQDHPDTSTLSKACQTAIKDLKTNNNIVQTELFEEFDSIFTIDMSKWNTDL